jgi:glycine cleavage system H protein
MHRASLPHALALPHKDGYVWPHDHCFPATGRGHKSLLEANATMIAEDLLYTKSHEWVRLDSNEAVIGITHYAQEQLGDLTFVELPEVGDLVTAGEEMGTVESVKAASELYSPVDGEVVAVNEELLDAPELVNDDPYGDGWMLKIALSKDPEDLLSPEEYQDLVDSEQH